jgi:hypothetical protein
MRTKGSMACTPSPNEMIANVVRASQVLVGYIPETCHYSTLTTAFASAPNSSDFQLPFPVTRLNLIVAFIVVTLTIWAPFWWGIAHIHDCWQG